MKKSKSGSLSFYICCFFVYCLLGWCYEVFLEVVVYKWGFSNRGVLFGPYLPIYGFGALAFIFTVYRLIKGKKAKERILLIPTVFVGCALIATAIELGASYLCEAVLGYWPWQTYVDYAINFQGRIALSPSIRFGIGGVVFLYMIQPVLDRIFKGAGTKKASVIITAVMLADIIAVIIQRVLL
jgi:uncharacterized membrane protein